MVGQSDFRIVDRIGDPGTLVSTYLDRPNERIACFSRPTAKSLVLGSSQDIATVNTDALVARQMQLSRRRSGGSAVIVAPNEQVWLDVFVPIGDPLFQHDVCHATWWLGELWRKSLISLGVDESSISVHQAGLKKSTYSDAVCFLGQGPGEVLIGNKKIVGVSQRRDRTGAWFFTMAMRSFSGDEFAELFGIADGQRDVLQKECEENVTSLDELGLSAASLRQALIGEVLAMSPRT